MPCSEHGPVSYLQLSHPLGVWIKPENLQRFEPELVFPLFASSLDSETFSRTGLPLGIARATAVYPVLASMDREWDY